MVSLSNQAANVVFGIVGVECGEEGAGVVSYHSITEATVRIRVVGIDAPWTAQVKVVALQGWSLTEVCGMWQLCTCARLLHVVIRYSGWHSRLCKAYSFLSKCGCMIVDTIHVPFLVKMIRLGVEPIGETFHSSRSAAWKGSI